MYGEQARRCLSIEAKAIESLLDRINGEFDQAIGMILDCRGRVVVSGIGKSGLIGRKISATLASTGTPSFFLHPPLSKGVRHHLCIEDHAQLQWRAARNKVP